MSRNGSLATPSAASKAHRPDLIEALVRRTGRRLAGLTLALVATLLIAVGATTALVAISQMERPNYISRVREQAKASALAYLEKHP